MYNVIWSTNSTYEYRYMYYVHTYIYTILDKTWKQKRKSEDSKKAMNENFSNQICRTN